MFRSLLVPVDHFSRARRIVERIAHLPLAAGASITLLHVLPRLSSRETLARLEGEAQAGLDEASSWLREKLPKGTEVQTRLKSGFVATEIAREAEAGGADLIVMGRVGARPWRDLLLGSTAERVLRSTALPVLVVRRSPRPYSHPLLALEVDDVALDVLSCALRILPEPRPAVDVLHAVDADQLSYRTFLTAESKDHREQLRRTATHEVGALLLQARVTGRVPPFDEMRFRMYVRLGSPRRVIEREAARRRTDLLVLGTSGRIGIEQVFLGSVAGDVLREVACDVLLVPPGGSGGGG